MPTIEDARRVLADALAGRDERIARAVVAGLTYEYIARAEGISRARVEQIVRRMEAKARNGAAPKDA